MLAVFHSSVANAPQELCSPGSNDKRRPGVEIVNSFVSEVPDAVSVMMNGGSSGMVYTHHKEALLRPRSFAAAEGIFCLFQGHIGNLAVLRQEYGLAKNVTEVMLIIEAYRTLRDRGPFPADQVVAGLDGHFVFILFDTKNQTLFVALDGEGKVPLYWGTAADGSLAFSDAADILKAGCGKSFAPFPPGCYFSNHMGLQSFKHPLHKLMPVPRVDSQGQELGATFEVDMAQRNLSKQENMHRVGSEANWAKSI